MDELRGGLIGAAVGAAAMWAWISFVNLPQPERFTIVYRGKELEVKTGTWFR